MTTGFAVFLLGLGLVWGALLAGERKREGLADLLFWAGAVAIVVGLLKA